MRAPAVQISGGDDFHCALLKDGAVECWSWNEGTTPALGTAVGGWLELAVVDLGTFEP